MRSRSSKRTGELLSRDARQPDTVDRQVARRIMQLRQSRGISREQLAERIGVSLQQMVKYEQGTNRIAASRMLEIANGLDVDITALFASEPVDANRAEGPLTKEEMRLLTEFRRIASPETKDMAIKMVSVLAEKT